MLSNAYVLAKFRFDTAENEPVKNLQNFRKMHFSKMLRSRVHGLGGAETRLAQRVHCRKLLGAQVHVGDIRPQTTSVHDEYTVSSRSRKILTIALSLRIL